MNENNDNESVLDNLARQLTVEERGSLLDKILPFMGESGEQQLFDSEADEKAAVSRYINSVYQRRGLLYKLFVFLQELFKGESKAEIVKRLELQEIYRSIRVKFGTMIDPKTDALTGTFLKEFVRLADLCENVCKVLEPTLFNNDFYIRFVCKMVDDGMNERQKELKKEALPDSLTYNTAINTKNDYVNEQNKRIKRFFGAIELASFMTLNEQLKCYEILSRLMRFDFKGLFLQFGTSGKQIAAAQDASCNYAEIENLISRLFRLIAAVTFDINDVPIFARLVDYYKQEPASAEDAVVFNEGTYNEVIDIINVCRTIQARVPMEPLLIYFKSNLLYKLHPVVINYDVTYIYKESTKTILDKLWAEYYDTLRKTNLQYMTEEMFGADYSFHTLYNLNPTFKQQMESVETISVTNIYSLNVCVEFLSVLYKSKIEPTLYGVISDGDFKKEKVRSDITADYYLLNNYGNHIREYDEKFNENKDSGKILFMTLRSSAATEEKIKRMSPILTKLNAETFNFVNEMQQAFRSIKSFLVSINDVHNPANIPIMNTDKIHVQGQPNLFIAVERSVAQLTKFIAILETVGDVYK